MEERFKIFVDSNGVNHKYEDIINNLNKVADDWERLGYDIFKEDQYADHVTYDVKLSNIQSHIDTANDIRNGIIKSFTIWQRVNQELTGECTPLFLK